MRGAAGHSDRNRAAALGCIVLVTALLGCASLPWPEPSRRSAAALDLDRSSAEGWLDLRGVVHVHTRGSHDSPGTLEEVVAGARSAGVRWVALTEHTRPGGPAARGWVDGVLLIPGYELTAAKGSILALGIEQLPERIHDAAELTRKIHRLGGLSFVGDFNTSELADPNRYKLAQPDGIEITNLHMAALDVGRVEMAIRGLLLPRPIALRKLARTPWENFRRWRQVPQARSIVGGVDAHAKIRVVGPIGGTVDRYGTLFRLLTTHVWVREFTREAILRALKIGQSYVAVEGIGRVDRFRFQGDLRTFYIEAPGDARLVLVCDGFEVGSSCAVSAHFAVPPQATVCRAEAWKGNRLWIVSSYQKLD